MIYRLDKVRHNIAYYMQHGGNAYKLGYVKCYFIAHC